MKREPSEALRQLVEIELTENKSYTNYLNQEYIEAEPNTRNYGRNKNNILSNTLERTIKKLNKLLKYIGQNSEQFVTTIKHEKVESFSKDMGT